MPSMIAILAQKRLSWLGHVCRLKEGRIPKHILYGELASGRRPSGRPTLRYKDTCTRDLKVLWHQPSRSRGSDIRSHGLAIKGRGRHHFRRGKERDPVGGRKNPQVAEASIWSRRTYHHNCCLHLQQVTTQLPISHRLVQPQQMMQFN